LGICVYERLHRIQLRIREEQYTCQVLAAAAIDGLARRFEVFFFFLLKNGFTQNNMLFYNRLPLKINKDIPSLMSCMMNFQEKRKNHKKGNVLGNKKNYKKTRLNRTT